MEFDELIDLLNRERKDYVKISFVNEHAKQISITTVVDDRLYERIFKQVNGSDTYEQLLSFKIFEYKTLDEYYNDMKNLHSVRSLYSRNTMDVKVEKITYEE
jgi:hypothetical protein